jgi:hypothetical protein
MLVRTTVTLDPDARPLVERLEDESLARRLAEAAPAAVVAQPTSRHAGVLGGLILR